MAVWPRLRGGGGVCGVDGGGGGQLEWVVEDGGLKIEWGGAVVKIKENMGVKREWRMCRILF